MKDLFDHREDIALRGFAVIENLYSSDEITEIINLVNQADQSNLTFRKTKGLFAIRRFLKEIPRIKKLILNGNLQSLILEVFGNQYFIVKSIYFDKPEQSNWFVGWHQDLTISVDTKAELPGFDSWTVKIDQFAVQPPLSILQDNFTIRIHLDDTDENNGALKVIPASHLKGICRLDGLDWKNGTETTCNVNAGGVMVMRPLLFHASNRTISDKQRRIIHIEFSRQELPSEITWAEKEEKIK
ncbi:phytanoyl-CoA dioxygenase family protein [Mucilaginibacter xinganensis]|uniref:Phytanoyl-CoA dioxygenase n=1 Tax=Mucilaginibacter xinganensis TaxID=1234841 RepID=A0A223NZQ6_9SPHI|nr:phytanoyl-CoA dioxygenase family protein [Mucilaginibacter xinganensis]ASU35353.1 phytanoyl-CoA dioxygenase [Mucilaginibacter xinganensis]